MSFEMKRNAQLLILTTPDIILGAFDTSANALTALKTNAAPGVTAFGWDPQIDVQLKGVGQFGIDRPVGAVTEYKGIKGSLDVEGTDGEAAILAALNRQKVADFIGGNDNKLYEFFAICNISEDDGAALRAHFIEKCRVDAAPKSVGGEAKRFSFQGLFGREFVGKKLKILKVDGNATPVTSLTAPTGDTFAQWKDDLGTSRYACLVLRFNGADDTVKKLELAAAAAAGYYAETDSAITLAAADQLATGDSALVVYLK